MWRGTSSFLQCQNTPYIKIYYFLNQIMSLTSHIYIKHFHVIIDIVVTFNIFNQYIIAVK